MFYFATSRASQPGGPELELALSLVCVDKELPTLLETGLHHFSMDKRTAAQKHSATLDAEPWQLSSQAV